MHIIHIKRYIMPKLSKEDQFIDLSDYGRSSAILIANKLKNTKATPIQITFLCFISGLIAVLSILYEYYFLAGIFLILKSILDAADGELSRAKKSPSYSGRYLDSISDIILNLLILSAIGYISGAPLFKILLAFAGIQLQGTLYNYYYVILRNNSEGGDKTSKIFETKTPKALKGETQQTVNITFKVYQLFYGLFDEIIYFIDKNAHTEKNIPGWFMTIVSIYGLGFQLLIISFMLFMNLVEYIIPFFIYYSIFIIFIVAVRKYFLNSGRLKVYSSERSNSYFD